MRFEFPQLRPRKHCIVDAVFLERLRIRDTLEQGLLCAAAIEPTSMVHEALSRVADLGNQRVMLLDALRHQWGERSHRSFDPFGDGVPPVLEKPGRDPRVADDHQPSGYPDPRLELDGLNIEATDGVEP